MGVRASCDAQACFLDLIEGNDAESRARLPAARSRPRGSTPPLTAPALLPPLQ